MKHTSSLRFVVSLIILAALVPLAGRTATFDIPDGDVAGLIAAIDAANGNGEADIINLAPSGTYTLTEVNNGTALTGGPNGLPLITSEIIINGAGATIQRSSDAGTPDFRIFFAAGDLTLDGATIKNGRGSSGAGLLNVSGKLLLLNSTVTGNIAMGDYYAHGGGIGNFHYATLIVVNCTISHNAGYVGGGGIQNFASHATIINSTIFENQADGPPGYQGIGDAIADAWSAPGSIILKNTIVASPSQILGSDLWIGAGVLISLGHNIVSDASGGLTGSGDLNSTDPLLGPLADNSGATWTHAPLLGSPAINALPLSDCTDANGAAITTDQRGVARPQGAACDIGSVELVSVPTAFENYKILSTVPVPLFGSTVSISGNAAEIATAGSFTSPQVFRFDGSAWPLETNLRDKILPGDLPLTNVNPSVSVSGGMALVGYAADQFTGSPHELAYVFRYNGVTHDWNAEQKLTAGAEGDFFGQAVSGSGSFVVVGAPAAGGSQGTAYVFRKTATWDSGTLLSASDGAPGDLFGSSVSISGSAIAVGAPAGNFGNGAVYVYRFISGSWVETQLIAADGMPGDLFGHSVSIQGNVAVVGAPGTGGYQGAIYVFRYASLNWDTGTRVTAADGLSGDAFGSSVSVSGNHVLVGAPNTDSFKGSAYVFADSAGTWTGTKKLVASDGAAYEQFGSSVSISSLPGPGPIHVALIGAPQANSYQGAAYVYMLAPNQSPVAVCQNVIVAAGAGCSASASIDNGSHDPDGDPITLSQSPPGPYPLGTTTVTLTTTDNQGASSSCTATVTVQDTTPPVPNAVTLPTVTGECAATLAGAPTATDSCAGTVTGTTSDPLTYTSQGTFTVTWTYTDSHGNNSSQTQTVIVQDTTPPVLSCSVATASLWPANNQLRNVGLSFTATDACSPPVTTHVSVYSDEPILPGTPDATYVGTTLELRAQRKTGNDGDGRVYLIVVTATDSVGNSTYCCQTVVVRKANNAASIANVNSQAANAMATCTATGSPLTPHVILP